MSFSQILPYKSAAWISAQFETQSDAANQALLARMQTVLSEAGVAIKGADYEDDSLVLRVDSDERCAGSAVGKCRA